MDDVEVLKLVLFRLITLFFILVNFVILGIALMFHPWKQENLPGRPFYLELNIWTPCRYNMIWGVKCFKDFYRLNAPGGFLASHRISEGFSDE